MQRTLARMGKFSSKVGNQTVVVGLLSVCEPKSETFGWRNCETVSARTFKGHQAAETAETNISK